MYFLLDYAGDVATTLNKLEENGDVFNIAEKMDDIPETKADDLEELYDDGDFYENMYDAQREGCPEYENYLDELAESQKEMPDVDGDIKNILNDVERGNDSGIVEFKVPPDATPAQIAQVKAYVDGCNDALKAGKLSSTGRVSTQGSLRRQASRVARKETQRATNAGTSYKRHVGHVPDTTWTGTPEPYDWLDLDSVVNTSLGGQANKYPIGYKPTGFFFKEDN